MNSVRTAKETQHVTITKINLLTLFKEIIAVYSENGMKHIKYKMPSYRLLKPGRGGGVPLGFKGLDPETNDSLSAKWTGVRSVSAEGMTSADFSHQYLNFSVNLSQRIWAMKRLSLTMTSFLVRGESS
jgi:hypothetical protein